MGLSIGIVLGKPTVLSPFYSMLEGSVYRDEMQIGSNVVVFYFYCIWFAPSILLYISSHSIFF